MFDVWRRRRAIQRIKPGDGRALKRFRWWQTLSRSLFYLPANSGAGRPVVYAVDVNQLKGDENGDTEAHLYRDGRRYERARLPAVFPIEGGAIEVQTSAFDASAWLNIALVISATVGSTERALRLKYNRWLDTVAD